MARFIAAMDHSGGSTGGVLERYGAIWDESNKMETVHAMRLRMVNSPDFTSDNIWGAILYQDTVERGMVPLLENKGIQSFLKIDSGCEENGYLKYFKLDKMIDYALKHNCYGTKMRSIVKSLDTIDMIVEQQFALAEKIYSTGLMPIIEPEVPIDHPDREEIEDSLETALFYSLEKTSDIKCILKLTPPVQKNLYRGGLVNHSRVERVVFLSGGYSTDVACAELSKNEAVSASFSRALSEGLFANQDTATFNRAIASNIKKIAQASTEPDWLST
jgi:fructose-bisphosphate aldolase, class I